MFFIMDAISQYDQIGYCTGASFSALPVFFFSIAVLLNINKWYIHSSSKYHAYVDNIGYISILE
jgi:hypothetical protein